MGVLAKPKSLTAQQVENYHAAGLHFPVDVLSTDEAAEYRRKIEAFEGRFGRPLPAKQRYKAHLLLTCLDELVRHPKILDAVEDVLGPNILVWNSTFFTKEAHNPAYVGWHQDIAYWGLDPEESVTAWVAITDSTVENGAMRVIPGTFKMLAQQDTFAENNMLSRGQEIMVQVDKNKAVDVVLRAGQASLHDARLAHGSEPNRSADRRIGFAIRYIPTHVRQVALDGVATRSRSDIAVLVRGADNFHHFKLVDPPRADLTPEAIALHASNT